MGKHEQKKRQWTIKEVALFALPLLVPAFYFGRQLIVPQPKLTMHFQEPVGSVAVSPDGKTIAIGSNNLILRDAKSGAIQNILAQSGDTNSIAFSLDNKFLVTGGHGTGTNSIVAFAVWDVNAGIVVWSKTYTLGSVSAMFSPDGKTVASNYGRALGKVQLWDASNGALRYTLTDEAYKRASMAFSPDGNYIAAQVNERKGSEGVRLWSTQTGESTSFIRIKGMADWPFAFSPDSKSIAVTSLDGKGTQTLSLIDVGTKKDVWKWQTSAENLSLGAVMFSPNGKLLFCDCPHLGILIFDAKTGRLLQTLKEKENHWGGGASSLAIFPDSNFLISKDGNTAKIWDIGKFNRSN
ncbi:MAG TPA: hypothetical protein VF600_09755 [Abditibacteriaceae bacterium]|jgi:WD40 repeat protein